MRAVLLHMIPIGLVAAKLLAALITMPALSPGRLSAAIAKERDQIEEKCQVDVAGCIAGAGIARDKRWRRSPMQATTEGWLDGQGGVQAHQEKP